jgi:hypothetical protein
VIPPAPFSAQYRQLDAVIPIIPDASTVGFSKSTPRMVCERFIGKTIPETREKRPEGSDLS